ncbi:MAG: hypothetical protein K6T80_06630 [Firmicutes bacterium]|nr:hypothetical protein [Bacillota bacterium]
MLEYVILALFCSGTAAASGAAAYLLAKTTKANRYRERLLSLARQGKQGLPAAMETWVARASQGMKDRVVGPRGVVYVIIVAALALAGFVFGIAYMSNILAAVLLAIAGVVFPEQVRRTRRRAYREKVLEQLGAAVRVFAAEYSDTPHTVKALDASVRKLPDPVGGIIKRAVSSLINVKNMSDVDDVLIRLGRELSGEYGKMFAQLLRLSFEDEAVKPLFAKLAARVTAQQDLVRRDKLETSMDRMLVLALNLAVILVYFMISRAMPESGEFFRTMAGKGVVALCLFSAVAAGLLDILFGSVVDSD